MRRKIFVILLAMILIPFISSYAQAASSWYVVNDNGAIMYATDTATGYNSGKWSSAAADSGITSLNAFFSQKVESGDVVYLRADEFTIAGSVIITKNVAVYGGFDEGDTSIDSRKGKTTIKGGTDFNGSIININGISESLPVLLDGLIIAGGHTANGSVGGGGILARNTILTVNNCIITDNNTEPNGSGGGIYAYNSTLVISDCNIIRNESFSHGGGIHAHESTLTLNNCNITDNTADVNFGGGIHALASTLTINNCTIADNIANYGGGIYARESSMLTVSNCTIADNSTNNYGGGIYARDSTIAITNCTIANNNLIDTSKTGAEIYHYDSSIVMTNTFLWNSDTSKAIYLNGDTGTFTASHCAFPAGLNITGITFDDDTTKNIAITSWNSQTSKDIEVNGVTHTVYRIEDNPELITLEGAGILSEDNDYTKKDQLGHSRANIPCIGAVEKVNNPELPETLTIDAIEGKSIDVAAITAAQGIDTWSAAGTLPDGLTLTSKDNTCTISGTPEIGTAAKSPYTCTITAANTASSDKTVVTVNVFAIPVLSYSGSRAKTLTEGERMTDFTITATNAGGVTWSSSGLLPYGLTASSNNNVFRISGIPVAGTADKSPYSYTVRASNMAGQADAQITITVKTQGNNNQQNGSNDNEGQDENEIDDGNDSTGDDEEESESESGEEDDTPAPVLSESEISCTYQEGNMIDSITITATAGENLTWSASGTLPNGLTAAESDNMSYTISGKLAIGTEGRYSYTVKAKNSAGEASSVVTITVERFALNLDELPEPLENMTLSDYLSGTLGLSPEQLAALTEFKVPAKITSLEGIADLMPNLRRLDLTEADSLGENLDLSVLGNLRLYRINLSGNYAVKTLNLVDCLVKSVKADGCENLVSIDVAGNESIEELILNDTDLAEINARGCSRLRTLNFANSRVSKMDLTGCYELQDLNFRANRVRRFHKDDFMLDKLSKLDAKGQEAYISLIEKIFDFAAFLLGYDDDGQASPSGITAQTGDKNLRVVIAYDESGSEINYDDSKYLKTGEFIFDKAPAKIVYYYETGLDSMDVAITGTPEGSDNYGDNDKNDVESSGSSGGCNSGLAASLTLTAFAFTNRHRKRR